MPDDMDILSQAAESLKPEATKKREAPAPAKTRGQSEEEHRQKAVSRGAPVSWRLHPDTKPAIERAAQKYNVSQRALVDFLLRAGLVMLSSRRMELPLKTDEQAGPTNTIELENIPDEFLG